MDFETIKGLNIGSNLKAGMENYGSNVEENEVLTKDSVNDESSSGLSTRGKLLNIMGDYKIHSILSLIPNGLVFDNISNHKHRFDKQLKIIQYLVDNPLIFKSTAANEILVNNFEAFYNNHSIITQLT